MGKQKETLISKAYDEHRDIEVCPKCGTFENSFTIMGSKLYFWFNTKDHSTHVVSCDVTAQ